MGAVIGIDNMVGAYVGSDQVIALYMGTEEVWTNGPFEGLQVRPSSLSLNQYISAATVNVKSSEHWEITNNPMPDWLSITPTSGDSGETSVLVEGTSFVSSGSYVTLDIESANYSATLDVEGLEVSYEQLSYIYWDGLGNGYDQDKHLDTGIAHTASTMSVRLQYYYPDSWTNSDRMAGYQEGDNGCSSDDNDFRIFGYDNGSFDIMMNRDSGLNIISGYRDLTFGDNYVYDNVNSNYLVQNNTIGQVPSPNCNILVDVSAIKVKRLTINDGNTTLFDGVAARVGNTIGLFDTINNSVITASGFSLDFDV